jgi:hypothetical protein
VSRRVTLPGADELFRATAGSVRGDEDLRVETDDPSPAGQDAPTVSPLRTRVATRPSGSRQPSGREKHDEKITVYVSPAELVELEHARLSLRAAAGSSVRRSLW